MPPNQAQSLASFQSRSQQKIFMEILGVKARRQNKRLMQTWNGGHAFNRLGMGEHAFKLSTQKVER